MKLTKLAQVILISCSILALGACSTTKKPGSDAAGSMGGSGSGAQSSGMMLEDDDYASAGRANSGHKIAAAHRTYYFDFDKSDLREEDKPAILANADYIAAHPNAKVILEGHTDPRGSREYNVALGERRANAVLDLLKSRGVNPDQIRVVSYGAEKLAVPGRSEQDYQLDRRAAIVKPSLG